MIRSNYFAVKDVPSYRQFCRRWNLRRIEDDENRYGFIDKSSSYFQSSEEKGEYMLGWSSDGEEDPDADYGGEDDDLPIEPAPDALFSEQLAALLAYDNVAIVMEIDHDKTRYLIGYAWAVNSKHEVRSIYLSDIYDLAEELGKNITRAEW